MTTGTSPGARQGRNGGGAHALLHVGDVKPVTDRRVDSTTVPCPVCKALPDHRCISTVTGEISATAHKPRRRMAVRALNATEDYVGTDVAYARQIPVAQRRYVQAHQPGEVAETASAIGINVNSYRWWLNRKSAQSAPSGPDGARYGAWLREQITQL